MQSRRHFVQCLLASAAAPLLTAAERSSLPLLPDPNRIIDLPKGFGYRVVSRVGERMSDGFRVPGRHDGMAAFAVEDGRVALVSNHEIGAGNRSESAFRDGLERISAEQASRFYDFGAGRTPGAGGTTTTIYNPATGETERQFLSLAGTEINCAGGRTPWGSWLSCEECFESPGRSGLPGIGVTREKRHGYVFEVKASADGLTDAVPLKALGRFEHEAAAVDGRTGIVYLTEDRHHSLFYRFLPDKPGDLAAGGRLQALCIRGRASMNTHNWAEQTMRLGESLEVDWIDLDDTDPDENDLRLRGKERGAATFARGEGLCSAGDSFAFTCTIGGPARLGQIFLYKPGPAEGRPEETQSPGALTLLAEAGESTLLRNADNLTMAPWGDLVVCEDTAGHCGLVGVKPDGRMYPMLESAYSDSELAGVCFSPDGGTMFINVQVPGMTLAIDGPWEAFAAL